eukprot:tig00000806_g4344.t1
MARPSLPSTSRGSSYSLAARSDPSAASSTPGAPEAWARGWRATAAAVRNLLRACACGDVSAHFDLARGPARAERAPDPGAGAGLLVFLLADLVKYRRAGAAAAGLELIFLRTASSRRRCRRRSTCSGRFGARIRGPRRHSGVLCTPPGATARRHGLHAAYLRAQLEELRDAAAAPAHLRRLPFDAALAHALQFGRELLRQLPAEATGLLVDLVSGNLATAPPPPPPPAPSAAPRPPPRPPPPPPPPRPPAAPRLLLLPPRLEPGPPAGTVAAAAGGPGAVPAPLRPRARRRAPLVPRGGRRRRSSSSSSRVAAPPPGHLARSLDAVEATGALPPLLVFRALAAGAPEGGEGGLALGDVRGYLSKTLAWGREAAEAEGAAAEALRQRTARARAGIDRLRSSAEIYQSSKCAACASPLDLPAAHFGCSCGHAYHERAPSGGECPLCLPAWRQLEALLGALGRAAPREDGFRLELIPDREPLAAARAGPLPAPSA